MGVPQIIHFNVFLHYQPFIFLKFFFANHIQKMRPRDATGHLFACELAKQLVDTWDPNSSVHAWAVFAMPKFGETLEDDIKVGTNSWMGSSFWWHKDGVIIWSAKNWLDIWFETWIHPVFLDVQCFETVPVLIGVAMMWLGFGWAASNCPYGAWSHLFNLLD